MIFFTGSSDCFSKSRQRRETTICRAAALHPLGYESIRLCATFWDNYCCAFAHLSTSVKQLIKVYACWVRSGRQKIWIFNQRNRRSHSSKRNNKKWILCQTCDSQQKRIRDWYRYSWLLLFKIYPSEIHVSDAELLHFVCFAMASLKYSM